MREILFRGKDYYHHSWVEGWYCPNVFGYFPPEPAIVPSEDANGGYWHPVKVFRETVGQYTGLTDKNGKKIFEGDILLVKTTLDSLDKATRDDEYTVKGVVVFNAGHFELEGKGLVLCTYWGVKSLFGAAHFKEYEVIGNIHDTPYLLKSEEDE